MNKCQLKFSQFVLNFKIIVEKTSGVTCIMDGSKGFFYIFQVLNQDLE
jgi:hypothetical protein